MSEEEKLKKLLDFVRGLRVHYQMNTPATDLEWKMTIMYADFLLTEMEEN